MTIITQESATEFEHMKFCIEASTLGIRPGQRMPQTLKTTLGNRQPFCYSGVECDPEGEVIVWKYRQALGCISLNILND